MLKIRPYKQTDNDFIYTSWVNSYRPFCRWMPKRQYQRAYSNAIDRSLEAPDSITKVACLGTNEDVIIGWVHGAENLLHYLFVRPDFRFSILPHFPVADMLTQEIHKSGELLYTHWTFDFRRRLNDSYTYRPDCWRPNLDAKKETK